jgi:hypothetical protein
MGREIADIEARLAQLREAAGPAPAGPAVPRTRRTRSARSAPRRSRGQGSKRRTGNPLAGRYMGFMRQVKGERKKAGFRKIKEEQGYERAIAAIKQHLGK